MLYAPTINHTCDSHIWERDEVNGQFYCSICQAAYSDQCDHYWYTDSLGAYYCLVCGVLYTYWLSMFDEPLAKVSAIGYLPSESERVQSIADFMAFNGDLRLSIPEKSETDWNANEYFIGERLTPDQFPQAGACYSSGGSVFYIAKSASKWFAQDRCYDSSIFGKVDY